VDSADGFGTLGSGPELLRSSASGVYMPRRPGNRILVVEDNEDLREYISEILAMNGYLANGAENGKEALDQLEQGPIPPVLIVLDLNMPVMNGTTFMQRLKAIPHLKDIPVLLMTAQSPPPALDVAAVLSKPFPPESLLSLIKRLLVISQPIPETP
jgi:CheY-like chemotaxis protein